MREMLALDSSSVVLGSDLRKAKREKLAGRCVLVAPAVLRWTPGPAVTGPVMIELIMACSLRRYAPVHTGARQSATQGASSGCVAG